MARLYKNVPDSNRDILKHIRDKNLSWICTAARDGIALSRDFSGWPIFSRGMHKDLFVRSLFSGKQRLHDHRLTTVWKISIIKRSPSLVRKTRWYFSDQHFLDTEPDNWLSNMFPVIRQHGKIVFLCFLMLDSAHFELFQRWWKRIISCVVLVPMMLKYNHICGRTPLCQIVKA